MKLCGWLFFLSVSFVLPCTKYQVTRLNSNELWLHWTFIFSTFLWFCFYVCWWWWLSSLYVSIYHGFLTMLASFYVLMLTRFLFNWFFLFSWMWLSLDFIADRPNIYSFRDKLYVFWCSPNVFFFGVKNTEITTRRRF